VIGREGEDHMGAKIAASIIICPLILAAKGNTVHLMNFLCYNVPSQTRRCGDGANTGGTP
jgi:hypothetical protein